MITSLYIWDAQLLSGLALDEVDPYPIQEFTWTYPIIGDTVAKPFKPGRWDTRQSADAMTIVCEGLILEDTTANYWVSRKALLAKVLPEFEQETTTYRHSQLRIQLDGDTDTYYADVQLSSFAVPIASTGSPTVSPFQFNWTCNYAYWRSMSSGLPVRI